MTHVNSASNIPSPVKIYRGRKILRSFANSTSKYRKCWAISVHDRTPFLFIHCNVHTCYGYRHHNRCCLELGLTSVYRGVVWFDKWLQQSVDVSTTILRSIRQTKACDVFYTASYTISRGWKLDFACNKWTRYKKWKPVKCSLKFQDDCNSSPKANIWLFDLKYNKVWKVVWNVFLARTFWYYLSTCFWYVFSDISLVHISGLYFLILAYHYFWHVHSGITTKFTFRVYRIWFTSGKRLINADSLKVPFLWVLCQCACQNSPYRNVFPPLAECALSISTPLSVKVHAQITLRVRTAQTEVPESYFRPDLPSEQYNNLSRALYMKRQFPVISFFMMRTETLTGYHWYWLFCSLHVKQYMAPQSVVKYSTLKFHKGPFSTSTST
jgi:hypothetical protein